MLATHTISDALPIEAGSSWVRRFLRAFPQRSRVRTIIATDDEGKVVGAVVAPKNEEIFGRGCGSVYLSRRQM
jgi:hypothetical protein